MSKMSTIVLEASAEKKLKKVTNFMGGNSYELNPIDTLKMVTASSIFGEPAYYRAGAFQDTKVVDGRYSIDTVLKDLSVLDDSRYSGMKTSELMETVINAALDADFEAVLDWAAELRTTFNMRLNPQVIMVLAANHPARAKYNQEHPNKFRDIQKIVMSRADEPSSQLTYQLFKYGKKNNCPNILKRTWAEKLESLSRYQVAKYKNANVGMINTTRICHANSEVLDELMKTGTVEISEEEKTWENLRSAGKSWKEILETIDIPNMALLRNLRNIFTDVSFTTQEAKDLLEKLKAGVKNGKQFPFRYYTAYQMIQQDASVKHKVLILDALEECMDIALDNMPRLSGTTMCLSDNSGSAWGTFNSEYGSVTVAEIGNLSSVITAMLSDEGYVGVFGDRLEVIPITKRGGVLAQTREVAKKGRTVGGGTENGIWLFWDKAIKEKEHWDNVFIYSDMQAGHGGLYGQRASDYRDYCVNGNYIDVFKMITDYRNKVFNKVNVFSTQTAGYPNIVVPEFLYRANVLYGWTGKEALFAKAMIDFWDSKDNQKNSQN